MIGDVDDPEGNFLYIARLKGSSYEMGKAFGQLFKEELKQQLDNFYAYYVAYLKHFIESKSIPPFIANFIAKDKNIKDTLNAILDLNVFVTKRYTNKRYLE